MDPSACLLRLPAECAPLWTKKCSRRSAKPASRSARSPSCWLPRSDPRFSASREGARPHPGSCVPRQSRPLLRTAQEPARTPAACENFEYLSCFLPEDNSTWPRFASFIALWLDVGRRVPVPPGKLVDWPPSMGYRPGSYRGRAPGGDIRTLRSLSLEDAISRIPELHL